MMFLKNNITFSYLSAKCFIPGIRNIVFFVLTVFFIGLMPLKSTAQPLADGKNKFLGCSMRSNIRTNFADYWNQVTPDDAGKWASVESGQDQYNWTILDNIYNYAIDHSFPYKHHTLIWGQQSPSWISTLDSASQRQQIEEWIQLVGERYPDMDFIDVVNEPINAPPDGLNGRANFKNALGGNGSTGWDWVITAFQLARQYCSPGVKLILNEYNILHDNASTTNFLRLIDTLKIRNLIDVIGIQGHYFEFKSYQGGTPSYTYSISTIKSNLDRLAGAGLPILISEFDINEADDNTQLLNYQTYFPVFWEHPGISGITLWGYVEDDIWQANGYLLTDRYAERPAMQWLRTFVQSPIRPSLISPVKEIDVSRTPLLLWTSSFSATSYHVQVAGDNSYSSIIIDSTVADTLLQLDSLGENSLYYWRVSAVNEKGASEYSTSTYFITAVNPSEVTATEEMPAMFALMQNYPNPFNPRTVIRYSVPAVGTSFMKSITLKVYDILGREIVTLVNEVKDAGDYTVEWDGRNSAGRQVGSGIYFYQMKTNTGFVSTKKLVLMK